MNKPYSIGLDIGTNSVGWAVINESCELVRYKHQNMFGSHLFAEAEKAEKRRAYRSSRRRLARRKQRIMQLQMLTDHLVSQKDSAFFIRLKESSLLLEDKVSTKNSNILFNDPSFTDRDYRSKYPTIYHLRKDLVESKEQRDIRLVYLALHHIIKYRGHFLYEGQSFTPGAANENVVFESLKQLDEQLGDGIAIHNKQVVDIITRTDITPSVKANTIKELFKEHLQGKTLAELAKLMVGLTATASKISDVEYEGDKFSFTESNYEEEKREKLITAFGDDFCFIESAESIYKWSLLQSVLKNKKVRHPWTSQGLNE